MRILMTSLVGLLLGCGCDVEDGPSAMGETGVDEGSTDGEVVGTWRVDHAESICLSTVGAVVAANDGGLWSANGTGLFEWTEVDGRYEPRKVADTGVMALRRHEDRTYGLLPSEGLVELNDGGPNMIVDLVVEGTFVSYAIGSDGVVALVGPDPERALFLWSDAGGLQPVVFPGDDEVFGVRTRAVLADEDGFLVYTVGGEPYRQLWWLGLDATLESRSSVGADVPAADALYASDDRLWAPVDFGRSDGWLAVSDDGGQSWGPLELPDDFEPGAMDVRGQVVVVVDDGPDRALISTDGGRTFELEEIDVGSDDVPPDTAGVFVMPDRRVFVTTYCTGLLHRAEPLPT